jgi:PAS domain S-box-containing protein
LNLKLSHKAGLIFCAALSLELIFVGMLWGMLQSAEDQIKQADQVRSIISHVDRLSNVVQNLTMTFVQTLIAPQEAPESRYRLVVSEMREEIGEIKGLVQSKAELEPILRLEETCESAMPLFDRARQTFYQKGRTNYDQYLLLLKEKSDSATKQMDTITESYRTLEERVVQQQTQSRKTTKALLLTGIVLNILIGCLLVVLFIRGITRRLDTVADNTIRVAAGLPLHQRLSGTDEITAVDASLHDMAEKLSAAQRREKVVVENVLDVICSIGASGRFIEVNNASHSVWGWTPEELIGLRYVELLADKPESENLELAGLTTETTRSTFENRIVKKDGAVIDMLWSVQWSASENSWFCVAHDITERTRAEQLKREFVSMISHDLRTPLSSVQVSLNLLSIGACGDLPEKAIEQACDAEHNLAFVMILINGLLDAEKMHAGRMSLRPRETNIANVIERAVEAISPLANRDDVKLVWTVPDIPLIADENRLLQVLVNFLSNALKFSRPGSEIKIGTVDSVDEVEVSVSDSGPGIREEDRQRIFQRFEQVDDDSQASRDGHGLGLAICKAIVSEHGGTIDVQSTDGKGSTFFFRIPKVAKTVTSTQSAVSSAHRSN